jgi:hypothetical protein
MSAKPIVGIPLSQAKFHRWCDHYEGGPKYLTHNRRRVAAPFVYFVSAFGYLKVGYSGASIRSRLGNLQGGCPTELIVEAIVPGDRDVEALWHAAFEPFRAMREWFHFTDELKVKLDPVRPFSIRL